jgi:L-seryl-tRNA(Ser) seleniumtransferase
MRIDKITLAGLAATLVPYLKGKAVESIPVWHMISAPLDVIEKRATLWAQALDNLAQVIEGESMVGGGSLPGGTLPTRLVAVGKQGKKGGQNAAQVLARRLRAQEPPIVGRLSGNVLLLDPRCVLPEEDQDVLRALRRAVTSIRGS